MFIPRKLAFAIGIAFLVLSAVVISVSVRERSITARTLTLENLPTDVIRVAHLHPEEEIEYDEDGEPVGEIEHYAAPEVIENGGPVYGIYGYRIVSVEYEVPESKIGRRMVGKEFPGWGLSPSFFDLVDSVPPYNHFHVGLKDEHETRTTEKKTYLIHFMLLSHDEELDMGLSCG